MKFTLEKLRRRRRCANGGVCNRHLRHPERRFSISKSKHIIPLPSAGITLSPLRLRKLFKLIRGLCPWSAFKWRPSSASSSPCWTMGPRIAAFDPRAILSCVFPDIRTHRTVRDFRSRSGRSSRPAMQIQAAAVADGRTAKPVRRAAARVARPRAPRAEAGHLSLVEIPARDQKNVPRKLMMTIPTGRGPACDSALPVYCKADPDSAATSRSWH